MCGIVGLMRPGGRDADQISHALTRMAGTLLHRGPDAGDIWVSPDSGIGFGHRRLSILDLSAAGAQPMRSACGRFTITFNGEIYNHLDIRKELERMGAAPNWLGHSDTETILAAVCRWGVEDALRRFVGMFALGLWDAKTRTLTLARDRFGEKPLYYGWSGSDLLFGSELKALAACPGWSPVLDRRALTSFMRYSYVPAPATIWQGIRKLPAGSLVTFPTDGAPGTMPGPAAYWSLRAQMLAGAGERIRDEGEAIDELERRLSTAIRRQCLSDVPVGAFLSGGVDSSTIVALMQAQTSQPVRTFTIGFSDEAYNEANDARRVAAHLGTDHTELYVDPQTAIQLIPRLPLMYDEPFADSSQIPTHLVSALARRHVTVALSGDAGDELFGGYNRHIWGERLNARFSRIPGPLKRMLATALGAVAPEPIGMLARALEPMLPARLRVRRAGDQALKIARILNAASFDDMYRLLSSIDDRPETAVVLGGEDPSWAAMEIAAIDRPLDSLDRMTLADGLGYLSDDILQKVDRAAMAVSLETRVPFLDHDLVEFAARVPPGMKVRAGRGKWLVRQLLYRHVPAHLIDRPKTGFSIPLDAWMRGPLKPWAADLLAPDRLRAQGLFNPTRVGQMWAEHLSGRRNHGYWLWNVLMAQAWHDEWCTAN
ncbi:asparagine synthase (glutamine-hydrolyzing) [Bradyrhizobium sp. HKCCYLS20291]|uniref:asparagine synthase (glutamine-hydrolyzing) n=1 Tax=Bradyrhizobium sp. HKCCYLS20291 TaxID=3420766 RepID=UPI003EC05320